MARWPLNGPFDLAVSQTDNVGQITSSRLDLEVLIQVVNDIGAQVPDSSQIAKGPRIGFEDLPKYVYRQRLSVVICICPRKGRGMRLACASIGAGGRIGQPTGITGAVSGR
jgi:hypothetical protein